MTRNLKALGLALLAICAMGAVAAQGASAATAHEFHTERERAVVTGTNAGEGAHTVKIGAAGTVECKKVTTESTQQGTEVSSDTYKTDTIAVTPHYSECTFGGQPATVNFNHCYFEFDSDTTLGNETNKTAEHANVVIGCNGAPERIEVHTAVCTVTAAPQTVKHAVRYNNGAESGTFEVTAEKLVVGKTRTTGTQPVNGCLTFPTGAIGTYTGNSIVNCFKDEGSPLSGTEKTTPTTSEGEAIGCTVSPGA